jgi:hypothetical protein
VRRRWVRAAVAAGIAVVVLAGAAGAFLAFGPVGIGAGPLVVGFVSAAGRVPGDGPAAIVIPAGSPRGVPAVIDAVSIKGSGKYGAPGVRRVAADASQSCVGIWWPAAGAGGFAGRCAPGGLLPLTGRLLPARPGGARSAGIVIEVGPPGRSGCWSVSRVIVSYRVGGRHYTQAAAESLSACTTD